MFHKRSPGANKHIQGFTLVELMIVVGISSIIGFGLFQLIKLTTQIIWSSGAKIELQQNAQEAMYWISNDFKSSLAASIGNVNPNPGFEIPLYPAVPAGTAYGWQDPLPGDVTRIGSSDPNIKSGLFAMQLANPLMGTAYESTISTFAVTGAYIFSGWLKAGGPAEIRLLQENGNNFIPAISTGCAAATAGWQFFSQVINQVAGTRFKIRLATFNAGNTTYFDDVTIAPVQVVFNSSSTNVYYNYEKFAKMKSERCRLYYDTTTVSLYRQLWNGSGWDIVSPDPLGKYVTQVTINNLNQRTFNVTLDLAKPSQATKVEKYQMNTSITPLAY